MEARGRENADTANVLPTPLKDPTLAKNETPWVCPPSPAVAGGAHTEGRDSRRSILGSTRLSPTWILLGSHHLPGSLDLWEKWQNDKSIDAPSVAFVQPQEHCPELKKQNLPLPANFQTHPPAPAPWHGPLVRLGEQGHRGPMRPHEEWRGRSPKGGNIPAAPFLNLVRL